MAGSSLIGALSVFLSLDSAEFTRGLGVAQKDLRKAEKGVRETGDRITKAGAALTLGITTPFLAVAKAGMEGAQAQRMAMAQVEAALTSMGNVAGRTAEQLAAQADALEMDSLSDADAILTKVTANLLTFGQISGEVFDRAQQSVVDIAQRLGGDLQGAALMVGKALNNPAKGLAALRRVGIQFTADQERQIKAMMAVGNTAGAQSIMLAELERQFGGAAKAAADTDPWRRAQVAIDQAGDAIGEALLPVIPPIADAVRELVESFTKLPREMQRFAVYGAAGAAAFGPLLTGVGLLTTTATPLIAKVVLLAKGTADVGAAGYAMGAGIRAALIALGPFAIAATAAYVAFKHWPEISAWIDDVSSRMEQMGQRTEDGTFRSGQAVETFGQRAAEEFAGTVRNITTMVDEFDQSLRDIQTWANDTDAAIIAWWRSVDTTWQSFQSRTYAAFSSAATAAVDWMNRMVAGIHQAIVGRMGATWDWLEKKVDDVGGFFYRLWDRVVGHSYVPDMVDGIIQQMARLQEGMVTPAARQTESVAESFRRMAGEVTPILDRLFPAEARASAYQRELEAINQALRANVINATAAEEAKRRLLEEYRTDALGARPTPEDVMSDDTGPLIDAGDLGRETDDWLRTQTDKYDLLRSANDNLVSSYAEMVRDVAGSLQGLVGNIKRGDWLGALAGVADIVGRLFGGGGAVRTFPIGGSTPPFAGFRAAGGPVMPNRSYVVGEYGPELFVPRGAGSIVSNDNMRGGGGNTYHFQGNLMTPEFWSRIQAGDRGAAAAGSAGAQRAIATRGNRQLRT